MIFVRHRGTPNRLIDENPCPFNKLIDSYENVSLCETQKQLQQLHFYALGQQQKMKLVVF
jgi:hypothetical protein